MKVEPDAAIDAVRCLLGEKLALFTKIECPLLAQNGHWADRAE